MEYGSAGIVECWSIGYRINETENLVCLSFLYTPGAGLKLAERKVKCAAYNY
jgi:hypothetical protein